LVQCSVKLQILVMKYVLFHILIYEKTSFTSICINYIFKKGLSYLIIISFLVFFINTTHSVTAGEEEFDSDLSCETHSSDRYKPGFFTMNIFLIIS